MFKHDILQQDPKVKKKKNPQRNTKLEVSQVSMDGIEKPKPPSMRLSPA
jgi:hypothetical protein